MMVSLIVKTDMLNYVHNASKASQVTINSGLVQIVRTKLRGLKIASGSSQSLTHVHFYLPMYQLHRSW